MPAAGDTHGWVVKEALDKLEAEIDREAQFVVLANDKGNKHGYGTIDRMRDFAKMEAMVPKATLDLYNKAHTSMNTMKLVKRPVKKKNKKKGATSHTNKLKLTCCACAMGSGAWRATPTGRPFLEYKIDLIII